jgi:hypothetical protein
MWSSFISIRKMCKDYWFSKYASMAAAALGYMAAAAAA